MGTLAFNFPTLVNPIAARTDGRRKPEGAELVSRKFHFCRHREGIRSSKILRMFSYLSARSNGSEDPPNSLQELRVPNHWLEPAKAAEEAEWLRVTLHKWLDEEYCPETTNEEISQVAANSFHKSLLEKRSDLGEILLKMAVELESISYKESFHGAFSSANAAVNLIVERMAHE